MFSFFNKKTKKSEPVRFEHNAEEGVVRFEHDGEAHGRDNLVILEEFTKHNNIPIFKGSIDNAYESDFLGYKDKCPLCNTPTVQHYSNFVWSNQVAARVLSAPAGHFCPNCPTVIIDDDMMKTGINKDRFVYWGVCAISTGFEKNEEGTTLFKTMNGEKVTYILDEYGGLDGILNSVHAPKNQKYINPNQAYAFDNLSNPNKTIQAKKKKESNKKKNKQAKQSRKANRKK
jgi:hypothetical protein